jgi:glycosyltransferase involved in cell wall biosynthesis
MRVSRSAARIVVFAPHFAEYSTRLAVAMARDRTVLLILNRHNRQKEVDDQLMAQARSKLKLFEFSARSRAAELLATAAIILRVLLFRPDILCVQEQIDNVTAWVVRLLHHVFPVSLTVHDPRPHSGNDTKWVEKNSVNRRDIRASAVMFQVHGRFCRDELVAEQGADRPIVETAHGLIFIPHADEIRACEPGRLLMFGRMEAYKGLDVLLDAASLLKDRGVRFALTLAGDGPELERLQSRIAAAPCVEIRRGYLSTRAAIAELQKAEFVVLPYLDASQSGVAVAAYANGRPVIASRVGGLAEVVLDGVDGALFAPGDARALADVLEEALRSAPRLHEGAAAAAARLDWDRVSEQLLPAWDALSQGDASRKQEAPIL